MFIAPAMGVGVKCTQCCNAIIRCVVSQLKSCMFCPEYVMQMKRKKEAEDEAVPETPVSSSMSSPAKCGQPASSQAVGTSQEHAVLCMPQADAGTPTSQPQASSEVRRRKLLAPPSVGKKLCAIAVGSSEVQHCTASPMSLHPPMATRTSPRLAVCNSTSKDCSTQPSASDPHFTVPGSVSGDSRTQHSLDDSNFTVSDSASKDSKTQPSGSDPHFTDSDSASSLPKTTVLGRPARVRYAVEATEKMVEDDCGRQSPPGMMTRRQLSLTKRKSDQHLMELGISASKLPKIAEPDQKGYLIVSI